MEILVVKYVTIMSEAETSFRYIAKKYNFDQLHYVDKEGMYCIDELDRCDKIFNTIKRKATHEEVAAYLMYQVLWKDFN